LGANHSFKALSDFDQVIILNTAKSLLDKEYWVTIDIPQSLQISGLQTLLTNPKFSLIYSVTVGDIMKMKGNVVIKIDDKDFKATNPGVWCWSVRDLITDEHFTDWEQYKGDTVL
jgi:lipid A disaccharide synthetase